MEKTINSAFFSQNQRLIFILLIITSLCLRWYGLDQRPLHHDESLHYMYSVYPIDNPTGGFYRYDPMLHGPILYTLQPFVFKAFGINIASSRFLPALIGSITIAIPFMLRAYLCPWSVIATTAFLGISPSLVYWSRFFIHDPFVIIGFIFVLLGATWSQRKNTALLVSLGLVFQFGTKENCYVTLAIFLGYLCYELIFLKLTKQNDVRSLVSKITGYCKNYRRETTIALLFFILCYCYLYTSGFRNLGPEDKGILEAYFGSILDGLYRKSIGYWIDQDAIERIKGPFLFHFQLYALYEIAFIVLYFLHLSLFILRASKPVARAIPYCLIIYLATAIYHFNVGIEQSKFATLLKLKDHFDLAGVFLFLFHSILLTTDHLIKKQFSLSFNAYFFSATLFTYSYLGEKVPWLSQYPLYFAALYFPLYYRDLYQVGFFKKYENFELAKFIAGIGYLLIAVGICFLLEQTETTHIDRVVLGSGAVLLITSFLVNKESKINLLYYSFIFLTLLTLRSSILTNFVFAGDPNEIMSQVHTTKEFDRIVKRVRNEIESQKIGTEYSVYAAGEPIWPLTAYLQGIKGYKYSAEPEQFKLMCYMFDTRDVKTFTAPDNFEEKEVTLRGWWLPDFTQINLKKFLNYVLNHVPWNDVGYSYARMYINHNPTCGNSHMKQ